MQVSESVRAMFERAVERYGADADFTTVVRTIEEQAGVEVRVRRKT
jgi:hypothetical protein